MKADRVYLSHEYFGVSLKVVWDTSHRNLPQLKAFIENILEEPQEKGPHYPQ